MTSPEIPSSSVSSEPCYWRITPHLKGGNDTFCTRPAGTMDLDLQALNYAIRRLHEVWEGAVAGEPGRIVRMELCKGEVPSDADGCYREEESRPFLSRVAKGRRPTLMETLEHLEQLGNMISQQNPEYVSQEIRNFIGLTLETLPFLKPAIETAR